MNTNSYQSNGIQKRFRKFSVQTYKKILKAWISCDSIDFESEIETKKFNESLPPIEHNLESFESSPKPSPKPSPKFSPKSSPKTNDKTIELNSSLESIPETPDVVQKRKVVERNKKVNKRLISEFFDFESEVVMDSKESFCDDIEETQKELDDSSQSIIDNTIPSDTQPIGQLINGIDSRSAQDMESVYLRSVKDQMIGKTKKFKLKYNYDPNIEVFSQEPNESELEDYEFDSFCVPNDTIEYIESSPKVNTNCFLESTSNQIKPKKFKRIVFSPEMTQR